MTGHQVYHVYDNDDSDDDGGFEMYGWAIALAHDGHSNWSSSGTLNNNNNSDNNSGSKRCNIQYAFNHWMYR